VVLTAALAGGLSAALLIAGALALWRYRVCLRLCPAAAAAGVGKGGSDEQQLPHAHNLSYYRVHRPGRCAAAAAAQLPRPGTTEQLYAAAAAAAASSRRGLASSSPSLLTSVSKQGYSPYGDLQEEPSSLSSTPLPLSAFRGIGSASLRSRADVLRSKLGGGPDDSIYSDDSIYGLSWIGETRK